MTKSLYAAFDRFPSSKGAATHIDQTVAELFLRCPEGLLFALGDRKLADRSEIEHGKIVRFGQAIPNFLDRTKAFGKHLSETASGLNDLEIVQFRDPWSGIPLLESSPGNPKFVYEVNGLPSVELPQHFPNLPGSVLGKITNMENRCLIGADLIVTPSQVTREHILSRGLVPDARIADKIHVVPNGADLPPLRDRPKEAPEKYLLYFGALQKWQGIGTLLRAFGEVSDLGIHLVICSSNKPRFAKPWQKVSKRLGIEGRVIWMSQVPKPSLQAWIQHAMMTLAPLTECPRNLEQGCNPLKILESMAAGIPVIASDLPVVREITDAYLVRPDRPESLAFAIRHLHDEPDLRRKLGEGARQKIIENFTWKKHRESLAKLYATL